MSERAKIKTRARIRSKSVYSINVDRSNKNLRAQLVSPTGQVLTGMSTLTPELRAKIKNPGNAEASTVLGKAFAKKVAKLGIKEVAFDRSGYRYHGRIKAFAEELREAGIIV